MTKNEILQLNIVERNDSLVVPYLICATSVRVSVETTQYCVVSNTSLYSICSQNPIIQSTAALLHCQDASLHTLGRRQAGRQRTAAVSILH